MTALFKSVRNNAGLCFLSFFFLPVVVSCTFWSLGSRDADWLTFYVNTGIFLLTLSYFYIQFNNQLSVPANTEDKSTENMQ